MTRAGRRTRIASAAESGQLKFRSDTKKPLTYGELSTFTSLAFVTCTGISLAVVAHILAHLDGRLGQLQRQFQFASPVLFPVADVFDPGEELGRDLRGVINRRDQRVGLAVVEVGQRMNDVVKV